MQGRGPPQPQYRGPGQEFKVPIPRLAPTFDQTLASNEKQRVIKACTNCRKRKVKCTGETPRCKNCEASNTTCTYDQLRKDRLKTAIEQNQILVALLKNLSFRATEEDKEKIFATLEAVDDEAPAPKSASSVNAGGKRPRKASSIDEDVSEAHTLGEAHAPASVGSNEDMDLLDEDLLRSRESREIGFVGQNSEVQWLRSLQRQMGRSEDEPYGMPYGPPGASDDAHNMRINAMHERRKTSNHGNIQYVADSSYYLDGENLEVDIMLDPYELPPPETAQRLFACYLETVHSMFPIIPESFEHQFHAYMGSVNRQQPFQVPGKWQAILNLVFAIGAQYSHLTNANWRGDSRDHLLYMTRAVRILGVKDTTMIISAPDLGLIQATGLLSFYYLVIGHVSRAWVMVGISLRFALAVGLHLRNEDPSAPPPKKEVLVQTWWSLHSVECLLSSITGRPCVIAIEDCTVPLPQILPEEQDQRKASSRRASHVLLESMTGSGASSTSFSPESFGRTEGSANAGPFLEAHIKISLTTRKILKDLYSPRTASLSWEHIQSTINSLRAELDQWATAALPSGAGAPMMNLNYKSDRAKLLLGFHYHSTMILITRPCLCRLERHIVGQSDGSSNFNQRMAETCVQAAQYLTLLLPDQPDPMFIYQKGPWWAIVHNIMQAMAVFLLEMLYRGTHMSTRDNKDIPKCIKKLLRWLRSMGANNAVAERAYKLTMDILKSGDIRVKADMTDLLAEDEAGIDRGHLFTTYTGVPMAPDPGNPFGTNQWESNYFDTTPSQPLSEPYFMPDQFAMPVVYGNAFSTNFDQENPISLPMDELWRDDNISPAYAPDDPLQQRRQ